MHSVTKTDAAYHELRVAIESGELKPGARLPTGTLEARLDMSPTPIREALRLLQRDGLVVHTPHHGMMVATFSPERILENYRIRELLEPLATELATERATDEELSGIRKLHEAFAEAIADNPIGAEAARLNADWHTAIYAASGSPDLQGFVERLWISGGRAMWMSVRGMQSLVEHDAILRRIEERNAQTAAQSMLEHLQNGARMHRERLRSPQSERACKFHGVA